MIQMQDVMSKPMPDFREGSIIKGQILEVRPREVLVDVGYKSEGIIPLNEFEDPESLQVGDRSTSSWSGWRTKKAWWCSRRRRQPTAKTGTRSLPFFRGTG